MGGLTPMEFAMIGALVFVFVAALLWLVGWYDDGIERDPWE